MRSKTSEQLGRDVCHYYENVVSRSKKLTCSHFIDQQIPKSTICRILQRYEQRGTADYKKKSGRSVRVATPKAIKAVDKEYKKDPGMSVRNLAHKLKLSPTTVHNIKVKKLGIKSYKAISAPKYTEEQKKRSKTNCWKIAEKRLDPKLSKILVMDDETYCPIDPNDVPGTKYYSSTDKKTVPEKYKYKSKSKFPKRYLVWQAIDSLGNVSKPYVTNATMNTERYLNECIKKRLVPFIKNRDVLFWPDMASCHYSRPVVEYFASKNIDFVEKKIMHQTYPRQDLLKNFGLYVRRNIVNEKLQPKI